MYSMWCILVNLIIVSKDGAIIPTSLYEIEGFSSEELAKDAVREILGSGENRPYHAYSCIVFRKI